MFGMCVCVCVCVCVVCMRVLLVGLWECMRALLLASEIGILMAVNVNEFSKAVVFWISLWRSLLLGPVGKALVYSPMPLSSAKFFGGLSIPSELPAVLTLFHYLQLCLALSSVESLAEVYASLQRCVFKILCFIGQKKWARLAFQLASLFTPA